MNSCTPPPMPNPYHQRLADAIAGWYHETKPACGAPHAPSEAIGCTVCRLSLSRWLLPRFMEPWSVPPLRFPSSMTIGDLAVGMAEAFMAFPPREWEELLPGDQEIWIQRAEKVRAVVVGEAKP